MTGRPQVYALHGLRLRSPEPLTGFDAPAGDSDVDVRWAEGGPVPSDPPGGRIGAVARAPGGEYLYVAAVDEDGRWTLRVPGICDFDIEPAAGSVVCCLDPSADPRLVAVLVSGLVVAFLLALDGHCVLHASAVEHEGAAIALAGPAGAGKSTLAALLCAAGARLVSDDVLRVAPGPTVACVGGSPQLRLRPRAEWALDRFDPRPAIVPTVDERLGVTPAAAGAESVPLAAVVLPLLSRLATEVSLERVAGATAVARLAGVSRVAGLCDPGAARAQFRSLAEVAANVPVLEAVVPWGQGAHGSALVPRLLDLVTGRP